MATDKGLGKGLSALISSGVISNSERAYVEDFSIDLIDPNPYQPRMHIDPNDLVEIADSIREHGVIQPIIITQNKENNGRYYIIAGERRYRASQLAGLKQVPVVIKDTSPQQMLEMALIENIQRKDLNALEEAVSFKQLQDQFGLTQIEIAKRVGLSRVAVTNKIRLLSLPEQIKEFVLGNQLSEGHARALLGITDQASLIAAANIIMRKKLSVRETEDLVRKINFGKMRRDDNKIQYYEMTRNFSELLGKKLGYTVKFHKMTKGGKLSIRYNSDKELKDLMGKILGETDPLKEQS